MLRPIVVVPPSGNIYFGIGSRKKGLCRTGIVEIDGNRRVRRLLEGRLARKGESTISAATEAKIAVERSWSFPGFVHLGKRRISRT